MAMCEFYERCPIYSKFKTEALKNIYIKNYCSKDFQRCERYKISKSTGQPPPENLLPDGQRL
ncbi:MAG TPA: hypothetical protein EYP63_01320 [Desulfotomaculum sp.]|nr:hypothetical protein [Desulfotomaculum sp.]